MNKNELIRNIANKLGCTLKDASASVDAFIEAVSEGLINEGKIQISGFGTFELKKKPARQGINPKTGEKIDVAATSIPSFKFGKAYKDSFNN